MKEVRIIVANDAALSKIYSEGWELKAIYAGQMYFDREIKKTRREKKAERTPEYQAFHDAYPKKSGITSDRCVRLVAEVVAKGEFPKTMEAIERYKKKIAVEKIVPKFILNPETFLHQRRYEDPFDAFDSRVPECEKWILEMIRPLDELQTKEFFNLKKNWEAKQKRDITPGVAKNIINSILWIET